MPLFRSMVERQATPGTVVMPMPSHAADLPTRKYTPARAGSIASEQTVTTGESEAIIAVMGATGSGKTTFINHASGSNLRIGRGLISCTNMVQVAQPFELDGRMVTMIDTPGFDDTTRSDSDILRMIAAFLASAYENGQTLTGVIYMHRISDFRMSGISTRNFKMFRQLCGDSTLKNVIIVTNMWGEVSQVVGNAREHELASEDLFFKPVLEKGAIMLRHEDNKNSAHKILRRILENNPLSLQIQRELVDEKKDISQTAAGAELNRELMFQIQKHKKEMRELQEEMREAIRLKDEEAKRELEIESQKLQRAMQRVQFDAQKLASQYSEEKHTMDRRLQELTESSRAEAERQREEHRLQLEILQRRLQETSLEATRERENLFRQMQGLRSQGPRGGGGGFFSMIGRALDQAFGLH